MIGELLAPEAELSTRLAKHPTTEGHNLARRLRGRDELSWLERTELRVVPTDECLNAGDQAGTGADDRLIVERQILDSTPGKESRPLVRARSTTAVRSPLVIDEEPAAAADCFADWSAEPATRISSPTSERSCHGNSAGPGAKSK